MSVPLMRGKERSLIRRTVTGDGINPQYYLTIPRYFSVTERFERKLLAAPPEPVLTPGTFLIFGHMFFPEAFSGGIGEILPPDCVAMGYRHLAELIKPEQIPEQYDRPGQLPKLGERIVCPMITGETVLNYTRARWHLDDPDEVIVSLPKRTHIIYLKQARE